MNVEHNHHIKVFYYEPEDLPPPLFAEESTQSRIDAKPITSRERVVIRRTNLYGDYLPGTRDLGGGDICRHCKRWTGHYSYGECGERFQKKTVSSLSGFPWCSHFDTVDVQYYRPPGKLAYTLLVDLWPSEVLEQDRICPTCLRRGREQYTFEARADIAHDHQTREPHFHVTPSVVTRCERCRTETVLRGEDLKMFDLGLAKRLCNTVFSKDAKKIEWGSR